MSTAGIDGVHLTGVNEHTEQYPLLSDDELQALADDIAENGLFDPITVTRDGVLLDGRNRIKACQLAGIEPRFDIYDGDENQIGAFVRSKNRRRHQPTGSRAMSEALSMQLDGKRKNGRWKRGSLDGNQESLNTDWRNKVTHAGVVLDHSPDLAQQVVDGDLALDAAYRQACLKRDEAKRAEADAARVEQDEEEAKADLAENAPEFLADVESGKFDNHREARAVWLERDRAAKRQREIEEQEHRDAVQRDASRVKAFLSGFDGARAVAVGENSAADEVLALLNSVELRRFNEIREVITWPATAI